MKIEELIEKYERLNHDCFRRVDTSGVLRDLKQLDELKTGHADEAPRYVKNILARLRELPLHNREVWLKVIISEFKQDFSRAKWREGYEQGKVEGMVERDKVAIPQYVANYIEYAKNTDWDLQDLFKLIDDEDSEELQRWFYHECNQETLAHAWLFGYEVEEEKRYIVKMKGLNEYNNYLNYDSIDDEWYFTDAENGPAVGTHRTRKELEEAGFGWVFDSPGFQIEEVE